MDEVWDSRVIYGVNPVTEALRGPTPVHGVWVDDKRHDLKKKLNRRVVTKGAHLHSVSKVDLFELCHTRHHQGVVARTDPLPSLGLDDFLVGIETHALVLIADRIQDPQNLGSLYRSADGAGADLVIIPSKKTASHQFASVAKASAGAVEHVPTAVVPDLGKAAEKLKEAGFSVFALEAGKGDDFRDVDFPERTVLVVGGEESGVAFRLRQIADACIHISMHGKVTSLNVGVAGAVLLFHARSCLDMQ